FRPKWAPIESLSLAIHWPDELPAFARPQGVQQWQRARELWKSSLRWIAEYEAWITRNAGISYRRECVATWLRPHVRAEKMASAWRFLCRQRWDQQNRPISKTLQRYTFSKEPR
ncbi:MAG: hypothetical protein AAF394_12720, partial [Planctomycetota bacterium]